MEKHNVFPIDYENAVITFKNFAGAAAGIIRKGIETLYG